MGCGLCHGPAAAPISKLRELYCNTAGIQAHCLVNAAVASCSIWIRTGWLQKSPFPGCSRMACGENRAGVCCMQRMRSMSYLVVLFLCCASVDQSHCSLLGLGPPAGDPGHFRSIQFLALPPLLHVVSLSLGPQLCAPEIFPLLPFAQGLFCRQSSFQDSGWIPDRCVTGSFAADAGLTLNL